METDWNKLIERYLQNELSEEGREAFEYELSTNPELKMEVDLHLMIMGSAVRSAERLEIIGIGKRFHFRRKLTNAAIISGIVVVAAAATYFAFQNKKTAVPKQELAKSETPVEIPEPESADTTVEPLQFSNDFSTIGTITKKSIFFDAPVIAGTIPPLSSYPETAKPKEEPEVKEAAPEQEKYWITTVRASQLNAKAVTKEEKPFYLSGNYTWANEYQIMDTPEGLYMFDTTNNTLTIFKSNYRKRHTKYGEMTLVGFKSRKYLTEVYQNRIVYSNEQKWGAY